MTGKSRKYTCQLVLGFSCSVLLVACGGGGSGGTDTEDPIAPDVIVQSIPVSEQRIIPTDEARAFRSDSPYASVLKECVLADICTLAKLPYIGQTDEPLSIDSVMRRV